MPYITNDQLTVINQRLAVVERRQRSRRVALAVVLVAAAALAVHSDISRTPFASGDVISASAVNAQLDEVYDLINGDATSAAGTLMPLAFGWIDSSGNPIAATPNVTASRVSTGIFDISIAGHDFSGTDYAVVASTKIGDTDWVAGGGAFGALRIRTYAAAGGASDREFTFVVFKP